VSLHLLFIFPLFIYFSHYLFIFPLFVCSVTSPFPSKLNFSFYSWL